MNRTMYRGNGRYSAKLYHHNWFDDYPGLTVIIGVMLVCLLLTINLDCAEIEQDKLPWGSPCSTVTDVQEMGKGDLFACLKNADRLNVGVGGKRRILRRM